MSGDAWVEFDRLTGVVSGPRALPGMSSWADDVGGVNWYDAPVPRRWHKCKPQTKAFIAERGWYVERCACGAIRHERDGWLDRNTKRRKP
jgi:hypothetical protein